MHNGRSTSTPNMAQQLRFAVLQDIGCIVARSRGLGYVPCEIHHLTVGGRHGQKRRGHDFTVGLNPWSHRGVAFGGWSDVECEAMFGPSYARQPRRFREEIGDDDALMQLQARLIAEQQGRAA